MNVEEKSRQIRENWPEAITPFTQSAALVQQLSSILQETAKALLKFHDLTYMEFDVLAALRSHEAEKSMTPTELYSALLISSGGLTKVLNSLENKSFIVRTSSGEDARQKPVQLTSTGREKLAIVMPEIAANAKKLLQKGFSSEQEAEAFTQMLKHIITAAEQEIDRKGA
nr:MarR family winged helix-turn-helix transcriptional regulator [uncultured Cohaesibacter sp.]